MELKEIVSKTEILKTVRGVKNIINTSSIDLKTETEPVKTFILVADNALLNKMHARKKNPLYKTGYLYLDEVYSILGNIYQGDRNIGITSENREWHKINVKKEILDESK